VAYVLRREGEIQWRDLGLPTEIDAALSAFREALRDPGRTDVRRRARAADRKIIEPFRALAGNATQLLLAPDSNLNLIPFEALLDEHGRYLVERYSIGYLTTGRDLLGMQVARASRAGPVVVANPFFGEPQALQSSAAGAHRSISAGGDLSTVYFAPLAGAAEEARRIQALFPDSELLTGQQATKAALERLDAPSILYIATHGFFLGEGADSPGGTRSIRSGLKIENPLLRSGLALAGANLNNGGDDGVLTALEASGLNLWGTKVVTLSACETGRRRRLRSPPGRLPRRRPDPGHEPVAGQRPRHPGNHDCLLHRTQERPRPRRGAPAGAVGHAAPQGPAAPVLLGRLYPIRRLAQPGRKVAQQTIRRKGLFVFPLI
jgi:CHAT domain-containing protein